VNAGATDLMSPTRLLVPLALSLLAGCASQQSQNVTVEKQSE
jgi:inhibitor of cysteine peptidase